MQSLPTLAILLPLKVFASAVIRSIFSGDDAMSTTTQLPGSPSPASVDDFVFASVQAAASRPATQTTAHHRLVIGPSSRKTAQCEEHAGVRKARRRVEAV